MKIVVGIDEGRLYQEALHLLGRLAFKECEFVLAHVGEPFSPTAYAGPLLEGVEAVQL